MYKQNENPYVFISYAHTDSAQVLPAIEEMKKKDICLWYDEGIVAGSEWPEFIAEKVMNCSKFILFISDSYLKSNNCKRELNFAISRKKSILSIYLEEVSLTPGMEMQLGTYQAIFKYRFTSDETFRTSLSNEPFFNDCKKASTTAEYNESQPTQTSVNVLQQSQQYGDNPFQQPVNPYTQQPYNSQQNTQQKTQQVYTYTQQPVYPNAQQLQYTYQNPQQKSQQTYVNPMMETTQFLPGIKRKSKATATVLSFFLGWCGVQFFYIKRPIWGILSILLLVLSGGLFSFLIGVVMGVVLLATKEDTFQQKYVKGSKIPPSGKQ